MSSDKELQIDGEVKIGFNFRKLKISNAGILIVLIILVAVFSFISPNFMTAPNWTNLLRQLSILMLLACGQTIVVLTAGIDLSVGSTMGLVSVLTSLSLLSYNPVIAILVGLATGAVVGMINGLIIGKLNITPFVVTLGMMTINGGLAMVITNGTPVSGLPDTWFFNLGAGFLGPIPLPVIFAVTGVIVTYVILNYTKFGRYLFAIGGNEEATILAGINVGFYKVITYMFAGLLSGVASIILTSRVITGQPELGSGMELDSIAAVVIGGTSLFGGVGSIGGTIIGVLMLGVIENGLTLLGVSSFMQKVVIGVMLILAIYLSKLKAKKNNKR